MKRIQSLLFFTLIFLLLQACKKDKAEAPPPDPIAAYNYDDDELANKVSPLLNGVGIGNLSSTTDSYNIAFRAIQFSGDGYVRVKDSDLLDFGEGQFTIAAWIRPVNTKAGYIVIKDEDANSYPPYALDINTGVVRSFVSTNKDNMILIEGKSPIL